MTEPSASPRILGSLREQDGAGVVHVEDVYDTDIHDLWSAITEPDRLARWLAVVDGDTAGEQFGIRFTSTWTGFGRVDVCDAPRHLVVSTWSDEDAPGVIEASLTEEADGTRLVIEESGLPLDEYVNHGPGWQAHIEDLGHYLAGEPTSGWVERWEQLIPSYRAMLERE